ncbi:MAG: GGDEF domain-containing protein [Candidatus Paceibacterota bacterium]|jgi:diguanylate cyclase (GGDEF)-like protein
MSIEKLKFGGPPTTPEEENEFVLDRNKYLLEHIAHQEEQLGIDHLTGLKNRKAFENELEKSLKAIREGGEPQRKKSEPLEEISLIFVDLDNFKQVNDTHGHLEGDNVLKKVAEILATSVREADVVARFGGDEFYVLLPRANEKEGKVVADKIRINLENDDKLTEFNVTASIGVSSADVANPLDPESLIQRADAAAYVAKGNGKNQVVVHNGDGI